MEENFISSIVDDALGFVKSNTGAVALGTGIATAGVIGGALAISRAKSKARSRRTSTKKGRSRDRMFRSKQKHEQRYKRKRKFKVYKSKSKRGIKYTKNGQPYKILANGRARFIKK